MLRRCFRLGQTRNHASRGSAFWSENAAIQLATQTVTTKDYSAAREPAGDERTSLLWVPVLDAKPRRGRRLAALPGARHPFWTYVCGVLVSFVVIAALSILTGLLITHVALRVHWLAGDDERLVRFLARHRSGSLTEASLVGSIMAGGVVLPIIAGIAATIAAVAKHWRLAGFLLFALAVESGSYRATTMVVHRHRPEVHRLENLQVDASYPSGHTAASIAIYWGIALLLTSRISNVTARICIWTVAALIPLYVAFSRMYRGMHHPLDIAGGVGVGIAALSAMVLVSRAADVRSSMHGSAPK
jgi:membrane-associated phospholipid phosphatase